MQTILKMIKSAFMIRKPFLYASLFATSMVLNGCDNHSPDLSTQQEFSQADALVEQYFAAVTAYDLDQLRQIAENQQIFLPLALGSTSQPEKVSSFLNDDELRLESKLSTFIILEEVKNKNGVTYKVQMQSYDIESFDLLVPEIKANLEAKNDGAVLTRMQLLSSQNLLTKIEQTFNLSLIQLPNGYWKLQNVTSTP